MRVLLAGYNIDKSLIDRCVDSDVATPEVISAAYARISRSSKDVDQLRSIALSELQKARESNENIIYDMGHSSIAEHAVFNLDLIGVSRYITEHIQKTRLASFTEKSQRYVTFQRDYVVPEELTGNLRNQYILLMDELFEEYKNTLDELINEYRELNLSKRDKENLAKEDARYILPLATKTQMGITINARSLEGMLRRLACLPCSEASILHSQIKKLVTDVAPSLVKYTDADVFYQKKIALSQHPSNDTWQSVSIISHPSSPDDTILASLIFQNEEHEYSAVRDHVTSLSINEKDKLFDILFEGIKSWHKLPKAFEMVDFTIEFVMSESCWSQFKRHRLCTIIKQTSSSGLGFEIPKSVKNIGRDLRWRELYSKCRSLSTELSNSHESLLPYIRTNSTRVRIIAKMNLRELYHFARLRSDEHAQWEIRDLSRTLVPLLKDLAPLSTRYLMGKSEFDNSL